MRLFVGLELPLEVKDYLYSLQTKLPGAKWALKDNVHLTLDFIGNIEDALYETIVSQLKKVQSPCFNLELTQLNYFGSFEHPHILWMGVKDCKKLVKLQEKIHLLLKEIDLKLDERSFNPHITIARLKGTTADELKNYFQKQAASTPLSFDVNHFSLFISKPGPKGHRYFVKKRFQVRDTIS